MVALPYAVRLFAALLALAGSPEHAPSPDEQRLFDEGTRAFSSGDAQGAAKAWQAGYALGHDPAFLVHIGDAQEKAGAPAQAAATYRRYLQQAPDASDRAEIEQRLARLAPPAARPASTPAPMETPGEFGAAAAAPSSPVTKAPVAAQAPAPGARAPAPGADPRADAELPPSQTPVRSGWNRTNLTAVVATAVTVVLLGTAGFYAAAAGSHRDDLDRLVQFRDPATGAPLHYASVAAQYTQAMDEGRRDNRDAKILLVGAGASAAVAALFFVLDAKLAHGPSVAIAPAGGGMAAVGGWKWRF